MSQTLYRKYRSQTFSELVGQGSVTQILRNAIRRGRLSHAYLFCGPRGTGKTSVARIFAKALCCLDPQDGDCCGKCVNCQAITSGNAVDVIEIDAASRNKIEDIRDLRDKVGYAPLEFPWKIYIIDEVHMVTAQGFNALLKTLEEPPAHVKFLFATTEPHKLPITILSRCIRFDFQRIPLEDLSQHLIWIAGQEGFGMDHDAAMLLSRLAEGSARDAISLLDQLTVYCGDQITQEAARELFQLGDPELPAQVLEMFRSGRREDLLGIWQRLVEQGADAGRFLVQISEILKDDYLHSGDVRSRDALSVLWEALNLLRFESFPALLVELSLLRCHDIMQGQASQAALQSPPPIAPALREAVSQQPRQAVANRPPPDVQSQARESLKRADDALQQFGGSEEQPLQQRPPDPPPVAAYETPANPREHTKQPLPTPPYEHRGDPAWDRVLAELEARSLTTYALLRLDVHPALSDGSLLLTFDDGPGRTAARYALQAEHANLLLAVVRSVYGNSTGLSVRVAGDDTIVNVALPENSPAGPAGGSATIEPAGSAAATDSTQKQPVSAEDAMELFGATELKDGD